MFLRHFRRFLAAFGLILTMIPLLGIYKNLPLPSGIPKKFSEKFSGVLRLWACEGWTPGAGSLSGWLKTASERFEKSHDGVYVQVTYVSPETLAAFNYAPGNPPDMILFSPGMLSDASDLIEIPSSYGLKEPFASSGEGYALPVAAGGYALAVLTEHGTNLSGRTILLPEDTPFLSRSLALCALLIGEADTESGENSSPLTGVDLGLPVPESEEHKHADTRNGKRNEIIPQTGSLRAPDAYQRFLRGEGNALVVTQREIAQLNALSSSGRAPEYRIIHTGEAFTDQISYMGIVDLPKENLEDRQRLCKEFLSFLLSDDMQKRLSSAKALRVDGGAPLYTGAAGMKELEEAYITKPVFVPGAFQTSYADAAAQAADALLAGNGGAAERFFAFFQ